MFFPGECLSSVEQDLPEILTHISCTDDAEQRYYINETILIETSNGTYCQSSNQDISQNDVSMGHVLHCNVIDYPGMNICPRVSGSHAVTFFSYLAMRTAADWARKSSYALLDGASLR